MQLQALLLGAIIGSAGVSAWTLSHSNGGGGVPAARQVPAADATGKADCCLIPANRGLYKEQP